MLMCRAHWLSLPKSLRNSIWITFRHRITQDYQALVGKAVDLILKRESEAGPDDARVLIDGMWTYYRGRRV
jgi:hypothetical protein